MDIIRAETNTEIRNGLTTLMRNVQALLLFPSKKVEPALDNISGTYEEMFSNWRNKMQETSDRSDLFSSFMSMVSLQSMSSEIAKNVAINEFDIMKHFDPHNPEKNLKVLTMPWMDFWKSIGKREFSQSVLQTWMISLRII